MAQDETKPTGFELEISARGRAVVALFERTPSIKQSDHRQCLRKDFAPYSGNPVSPYARCATAFFVDQLNSVPSTHMRRRMTASLRATA